MTTDFIVMRVIILGKTYCDNMTHHYVVAQYTVFSICLYISLSLDIPCRHTINIIHVIYLSISVVVYIRRIPNKIEFIQGQLGY